MVGRAKGVEEAGMLCAVKLRNSTGPTPERLVPGNAVESEGDRVKRSGFHLRCCKQDRAGW